jgi:hypothetical protein
LGLYGEQSGGNSRGAQNRFGDRSHGKPPHPRPRNLVSMLLNGQELCPIDPSGVENVENPVWRGTFLVCYGS